MARPSMKDQRRREVLDAYLRCVARFGLEGATLERVAGQAGLKRPLIRHHLGNRDEMTAALVIHVANAFDAMTAAMRAALPQGSGPLARKPGDSAPGERTPTEINPRESRIGALLNFLFDMEASDPGVVLVFAALTRHAQNDADTRAVLSGVVARYESFLREELARAFPSAPHARVAAVAQGLMALSFNLDALSPLAIHDTWRVASRHAAELLIATVDSQ